MQDQEYDVYGVGHALVDIQFEVEPEFLERLGIEKGVMTLIDPDRQARLTSELAQPPIASCSGGSAANTMIGVVALGGTAYYACQVGDDRWGDFYLRDLRTAGVGCSPHSQVPGITGQCIVLVTPDADRTLNTFLGVGSQIEPDQVDPRVVAASRFVYLEGYLVSSDNGLDTCRFAQRVARDRRVPVALTLSDPSLVSAFHPRFADLFSEDVDIVFCNEDEAKAYTGRSTLTEAGRELAQIARVAFVTCGARGAWVYEGETEAPVSAVPAQAVDTTGAGDLFAGGVLYGLARGLSPERAARLGNHAAAEVVTRFGSRVGESFTRAKDSFLPDV